MNATATSTSLPRTATDWQVAGLDNAYNLSDGHARYTLPTGIRPALTAQLTPALFGTDPRTQVEFERDFATEFYRLAGQSPPPHGDLTFHYAASVSIDCAARALIADGVRRIGLLTPTFDNIPLLLRRSGLELVPLAEDRFWTDAAYRSARLSGCEALFLVVPNNPTGYEPAQADLLTVAGEAARAGRRLVVDCSFRFYSRLHLWDQYAAIAGRWPDLAMVVIEDTGKTWPTAELKVGFAYTTGSLLAPMRAITNEVLLAVSPATLGLLTELIGMEASPETLLARQVVDGNRQVLRAALAGLPVEVVCPDSAASVEWLRLTGGDGVAACDWLERCGVSVLPGNSFHWHDGGDGGYIRVALSRTPEYFGGAVARLRAVLRESAP